MKYMLDTNICIYLMRDAPQGVVGRFNACEEGDVAISAVTWAELCCAVSKDGEAVLQSILSLVAVLPFGVAQGRAFGRLKEICPDRKVNFDRMIAAHALSLDLVLVTNNTKDLEIYKGAGLKLENWVQQ